MWVWVVCMAVECEVGRGEGVGCHLVEVMVVVS